MVGSFVDGQLVGVRISTHMVVVPDGNPPTEGPILGRIRPGSSSNPVDPSPQDRGTTRGVPGFPLTQSIHPGRGAEVPKNGVHLPVSTSPVLPRGIRTRVPSPT